MISAQRLKTVATENLQRDGGRRGELAVIGCLSLGLLILHMLV